MMNSARDMLSDIDEESNEDGPRKERLTLENDVHIGRGGEINKKRQHSLCSKLLNESYEECKTLTGKDKRHFAWERIAWPISNAGGKFWAKKSNSEDEWIEAKYPQVVKTIMQALRDRRKGMNEKPCEPNDMNTLMRRKAAKTSRNASRKTKETDESNISKTVVANNIENIDFDCSKLTTSTWSIDERNGNSGVYDMHDALHRIAFLEKNLAALRNENELLRNENHFLRNATENLNREKGK